MQLFSAFHSLHFPASLTPLPVVACGRSNELLIVGILANCLHNWTIAVRLVDCLIKPLKRHKINKKV